jgi:hypothetical protein
VLAFAMMVYWQLRDFKAELALHRAELVLHRNEEVKTREDLLGLVRELVNRDRSTDAIVAAVKEEISGVHDAPLPSVIVQDDDPTPVDAPAPRNRTRERAASPVVIVRRARPGDRDKP